MCVVSNIGGAWAKSAPSIYPWAVPDANPQPPAVVTPAEMAALRREMEELRKLLLAAKAFDAATGQPDCEEEEKVALIKRLAEIVGVDMTDVFKTGETE